MLAASKMKTQQKICIQSGFKHGDNLYSRMYLIMNQGIEFGGCCKQDTKRRWRRGLQGTRDQTPNDGHSSLNTAHSTQHHMALSEE
ncbi:putative Protein IMPACT like protein [Fusarium oxysporum f. sp. albedinis]|nr:putative Protein IMPACT like protein [Fusarium oxysporum f. sp. albedinis]